jgi:hypothetical protein
MPIRNDQGAGLFPARWDARKSYLRVVTQPR